MTTSIYARLAALEQRSPRGCATCRDWTATVLIDDAGVVGRPEMCPTCGREVPVEQWIAVRGVSLGGI